MKIIFLDHDGVICLPDQWGGRNKKQGDKSIDPTIRFDNFDKKAVNTLNSILLETNADIVVTSDWREYANLEEMKLVYSSYGVIKQPIDYTPFLNGSFNKSNNRTREIENWLINHPEVEKWVAVDDKNLGKLENFIHIKRVREGIKQVGVKEKIIKYLL